MRLSLLTVFLCSAVLLSGLNGCATPPSKPPTPRTRSTPPPAPLPSEQSAEVKEENQPEQTGEPAYAAPSADAADVQMIEVPLDENGDPIEADADPSQSAGRAQAAGGGGAPLPAGDSGQGSAARSGGARPAAMTPAAAGGDLTTGPRMAIGAGAPGHSAGAADGRGQRLEDPDSRGGGGAASNSTGLGSTPDQSGEEQGNFRMLPAAAPSRADTRDDDIVARQLYEAATREADPALREKLWEEYRRYKAGL